MYRVFACLTTEHDPWLVGLAALVCIATALTSFLMYSIACAHDGRQRLIWAAVTGVCAGSGIWATHFVAMLAYQGSFPTHYEPVVTITSLLIAIGVAASGFALSTGNNRWAIALGGAIIGIAIGSMHFTGMAALMIPGEITWDASLVAYSWVIGIAIASAAMLAYRAGLGHNPIVVAGGLLTLAICGLHFTAMGAVTIVPDPTVEFELHGMNRFHLALAVASVTFIVLLSAVAAVVVQQANMRGERALRERNALFEAALRYLPVGLTMFDAEQRLVMCNPAFRELYRLSDEAARPGARFADLVGSASKLEARDRRLLDHHGGLIGGAPFSEVVTLSDGRTILKKVGPIAGAGWVDVQEDITERTEQEAKIAFMAQHDMLTGLANRSLLLNHLENGLDAVGPERKVALLFVDLDRFKGVNDTLGHQVGDDLLKRVAQRLSDCVRNHDLVARLGGDEFVVLQISDQPWKVAAELAARIIASLSAPFHLHGQTRTIGASVGIAVAGDKPMRCEVLLAQADAALYRAKRSGRSTFRFFQPEPQLARAV